MATFSQYNLFLSEKLRCGKLALTNSALVLKIYDFLTNHQLLQASFNFQLMHLCIVFINKIESHCKNKSKRVEVSSLNYNLASWN